MGLLPKIARPPKETSIQWSLAMRCPRWRRRVPRQPITNGRVRPAAPENRGAAVVELAVLLPLLALLFVIAVDFSRAFYFSLTLQNCARAGAMYASDPFVADESPFDSAEEAARSDATNLDPAPTVTTANGADPNGRSYVEVTATYPYRTILQFPGIPSQMTLTRSVRMYYAAITPDTN
jgi:Flp pilus assembly protein TadG